MLCLFCSSIEFFSDDLFHIHLYIPKNTHLIERTVVGLNPDPLASAVLPFCPWSLSRALKTVAASLVGSVDPRNTTVPLPLRGRGRCLQTFVSRGVGGETLWLRISRRN